MRTRGIGGGPFSYTWSFPVCPHRVTIDLSIVEALQLELAMGAAPRYGLLFGQTSPGLTQIDQWQTLPVLDAPTVEAALTGSSRQVVGYYVIRDGSAFVLSPAEVGLAQDFFNKQGSVVLLVERRRRGPAEASFFFWRQDVFVHNLPLPFPFHAGILSGETPGLAEVPAGRGRPRFWGKAQSRFARLAVYGVCAMAAGGLLAAYFRDIRGFASFTPAARSRVPEEAAIWIPTQPRQDLELIWDARSEAVSNATAGVLKIEDGGQGRQITLDVGELLLGAVLYAPISNRIRVELMTLQRDGRMAPVALASRTASATIPATTPPLSDPEAAAKTDPLNGLAGKAALPEKRIDLATPGEEERRPPLKRFTWNGAAPLQKSSPEIPEAPHAAPPAIAPSALTATLPPSALGVPTAPPPPPPAPKANPAPVRQIPRAGRVIWTGTLQRRGIVEVDGRSVSVGALNGTLPGVPVNLTITPAEFGSDGLVVYTTEASRHNRVEPPSAGNGWNQVTFVWDPERVRQLTVLEAPNANNGYNRITLRNDARRCSMILIDWTVR